MTEDSGQHKNRYDLFIDGKYSLNSVRQVNIYFAGFGKNNRNMA